MLLMIRTYNYNIAVTIKRSYRRCSVKKLFLEISQYSLENNCVGVSFYWSCRASVLQLYLKETPTLVFPCEYCEIFKNTNFEEHLQTAASVLLIIRFLMLLRIRICGKYSLWCTDCQQEQVFKTRA